MKLFIDKMYDEFLFPSKNVKQSIIFIVRVLFIDQIFLIVFVISLAIRHSNQKVYPAIANVTAAKAALSPKALETFTKMFD